MTITDMKGSLHDHRVLAVLSYCQYMPTDEKLNRLAGEYESDKDVYAFSCMDGGAIAGIIIIKRQQNASFEILGIAVDPALRGRGIGAKLIAGASALLACDEVYAQTDDDSVVFYRKCGFEVHSLGEKYPGVTRYLCTLELF